MKNDSNKTDWRRLSKILSYALRHHPESLTVDPDSHGWVDVDLLLVQLRHHHPGLGTVTINDLHMLIRQSDKPRFEINDNRIRARYGHSISLQPEFTPVSPPPTLYHGTAPAVIDSIRQQGLLPMNRQYVHLSPDRKMAHQVGNRHAARPVILVIDASRAHLEGIVFYAGAENVWLADTVPPEFIRFPIDPP